MITPCAGRVEINGKQGDLTPLLLIARDRVAVAELAPEIAARATALVADIVPDRERRPRPFTTSIARLHRLFVRREPG